MTTPKISTSYQVLDNTDLAGANSIRDEFGYAVAASGKTLVVGARRQDVAADLVNNDRAHREILLNVGGVYIYEQQEKGRWGNPLMLLPPNPQSSAMFGRSVATNGETVVVGSPNYDTGNNNNVGCVYIYERTAQGWQTHPAEQFMGATDKAQFGYSVAISGDVLVIGAPRENDDDGAVYVSRRQNGRWSEPLPLPKPQALAANGRFGRAVAIDGKLLVVGAPDSVQGQAFVYDGDAVGAWKNPITLRLAQATDRFGRAVAVHGARVLVGCRQLGIGNAYVFAQDSWDKPVQLPFAGTMMANVESWRAAAATALRSFGQRVALGANTAVIGAPEEHGRAGKGAGRAYLYRFEDGSWQTPIVLESPDLDGNEADGFFGGGLAITEIETAVGVSQAVIIGAYLQDPQGKQSVGRVFVCQQDERGRWPLDAPPRQARQQKPYLFDTTTAWDSRLQNVLDAVHTSQTLAEDMVQSLRQTAHTIEDWYELTQLNALSVLLENLHTFGHVRIRNSFRALTVRTNSQSREAVPTDKLRETLNQMSTDLEIIQRALDQRRRLRGNSTGLGSVLLTADVVAAQAIKPARGSLLQNRYIRVVTYLSEVMGVRVLPYDPDVILIGIPFASVAGAQLDGEKGNLRQMNWDFLALPHEIAHFLYRYETREKPALEKQILAKLETALAEKAIAAHKAYLAKNEAVENERKRLITGEPAIDATPPAFVYNWLEELFADVYGCLLAGPISVFGLQDILSDGGEAEMFHDNGHHPVPAIRPFIGTDILRQISSDDTLFKQGTRSAYKKLVYLETPQKLDENWLDFLYHRFAEAMPAEKELSALEEMTFALQAGESGHTHEHGEETAVSYDYHSAEQHAVTLHDIRSTLQLVINTILETLSENLYLSGDDFPWSFDAPNLDSLYQTLTKGIPMPVEPFGKLPDPTLYDWQKGHENALKTIDENLQLWTQKGPEGGHIRD